MPVEPPVTTPPQPRWKRLLPFAIAAALLGFGAFRLDLRAFAAHLAAVNAPLFFLLAAVFVLALLSADAFATVVIYRRTIAPVRYRDYWVLRGASYLPSILNHNLGQAFVTYFLARFHGVSLARAAGATMLSYATSGGCVLAMGCLALLAQGRNLLFTGAVVATGLAYLALIAAKPAKLARVRLFAPLFDAGVGGHLVALAARVPHILVLFLGTWLPFKQFGVDIPLAEALVSIPILIVAVTLPLTPHGFGTRDMVAAVLFQRFAPGDTPEQKLAAIAAATASWPIALLVVEALLGFVLLKKALPQLEARAPSSQESAAAE